MWLPSDTTLPPDPPIFAVNGVSNVGPPPRTVPTSEEDLHLRADIFTFPSRRTHHVNREIPLPVRC